MRIKVKILEPKFIQIVSEHMYMCYVLELINHTLLGTGILHINTIGPYDIK